MNRFIPIMASICLAAAASPASAAVPIYPDGGTENPNLYTFTASASGSLLAYFTGASGSFSNTLGLSVNGGAIQYSTLNNLTSAAGDSFDFGTVTAGDLLTFVINVNDGEFLWFSDRALNADGTNHVWSADYAGGDFGIPAGTFVGFEDLPGDGTDFNYNDIGFVFTNVASVATPAVPEPATWALMILGFGAIGAALRSRRQRLVLTYT